MERKRIQMMRFFAGFIMVLFSLAALGPGCIQTFGANIQRQLGKQAYRNGEYAKAISYYQKAAERGDATACYELYSMYREGRGVAKDRKMALKWLKRGAELGDTYCQLILAGKFLAGHEVERNPRKSLELYLKAAAKEHRLAYYNLGLMYAMGVGTKPDLSIAVSYFRKAKAAGLNVPKTFLDQSSLRRYLSRKGRKG